jgi:hypothetical protein
MPHCEQQLDRLSCSEHHQLKPHAGGCALPAADFASHGAEAAALAQQSSHADQGGEHQGHYSAGVVFSSAKASTQMLVGLDDRQLCSE